MQCMLRERKGLELQWRVVEQLICHYELRKTPWKMSDRDRHSCVVFNCKWAASGNVYSAFLVLLKTDMSLEYTRGLCVVNIVNLCYIVHFSIGVVEIDINIGIWRSLLSCYTWSLINFELWRLLPNHKSMLLSCLEVVKHCDCVLFC